MLRLLTAFLLLLPLAAKAQTEPQTLVDRATLTVQEMLSDPDATQARELMTKAKAALVCPRVFKAGFIFGGQGGDCVLIGRGAGNWTSPAFYTMGSGSIGFQIGIQDSQILFIILTDRGLQALMDSQFKIGADAMVAFASLGGGVQGGTTAAFRADVVAFAQSRGLFAGLAIDGAIISQRSDWNRQYYGRPAGAQTLVMTGDGQNPGADPLREMLARYSAGNPNAARPVAESMQVPPPPMAAPSGRVQATPLGAPRG